MLKKILFLGLILAVIGGFIGYKMYHKPHADMGSANPDLTMDAAELYNAYTANEEEANQKYLGKIIQISGTISSIMKDDNTVKGVGLETGDMLTGLNCMLDVVDTNHRQDFRKGSSVTFNCKCNGKLMDIELNRCVEVNK